MNNLVKLILFFGLLLNASCKKEGCMDDEALNIDYEANVDDFSCKYEIEKMAGTFQVEGYKIPYLSTDTIHYSYALEVSYLQKNKALLTNLGGMNQSIEIVMYDHNSRLEMHTNNNDSIGIRSGLGNYYDSNFFGLSYIEGVEQTKHIDIATR